MGYTGGMSTILASRLDGLDESATMALNARAKQLQQAGKTIYNLTAGELASDTPEYIRASVAQVLERNKYTAVAGLPELRQAIADAARASYSLDWIEPSNVIVTAGAKPALYTSLQALIDPGDEVIVPVPAWVSYKHLIELVGGVVVEVPLTDTFDLDFKAIAAQVSKRTKAIVINSPHNPTGAIFSKPALEGLAKTLEGSHVMVIADDIYARLIYDDSFTLVPTCGFEKLVIINGFSKSQALTGWRIGYVIAEQHVAAAIAKLLSHTMGNASVPSQHAALAAMARHDTPPAETTTLLKRHLQLVEKTLNACAPLTYRKPGGAFYVFIDLRAITKNSAAWCEQLLEETGVALVPGEAFSAPGFARLSFVADEATLKGALTELKRFVAKKGQA
jgi:aspartate/methionine/tyrosine aminotransferase